MLASIQLGRTKYAGLFECYMNEPRKVGGVSTSCPLGHGGRDMGGNVVVDIGL
jgi:hypothetical protein